MKYVEPIRRLHLILTSVVSSSPLLLMLRALEIRVILTTYPRLDSGVEKVKRQERGQGSSCWKPHPANLWMGMDDRKTKLGDGLNITGR